MWNWSFWNVVLGFETHNLLNMSLLPEPLDQNFRPTVYFFKRDRDLAPFYDGDDSNSVICNCKHFCVNIRNLCSWCYKTFLEEI